MRSLFRTTATLTLLLLAVSAQAEEVRTSLAAELGWVKFRVTAGRLHLVNTHWRENRAFEAGNPLAGESERFRLNVQPLSASVLYERQTPKQSLTVDFDSPYSVLIQRKPVDEGDQSLPSITFIQPRDGELRLTVGSGSQQREIKAASIWHLMMLEREATQKQLLPILQSLRPGWPLVETADGIEDALVQAARSDTLPNRAEWAKLVEQLGSSSFAARRQAERQLHEAGPAVVVYLQTLPLEKFDAERRTRLERLLDSLSSTADDTPARIAVWLIDDPLIWTKVLESDDVDHRRAAPEHLAKLLGQQIEFDAEAGIDVRAKQIQAIQKSLP